MQIERGRWRVLAPIGAFTARWEFAVHVFVIVQCQPLLMQIVLTGHPPGRFAGHLHGRQQQRNEHADNRDHDEQLDQREAAATVGPAR